MRQREKTANTLRKDKVTAPLATNASTYTLSRMVADAMLVLLKGLAGEMAGTDGATSMFWG